MSIYNNDFFNENAVDNTELMPNEIQECTELILANAILETCVDQKDYESYINSNECKLLEESGVFKRNTLMRLNKVDDLERRTKLAALQLAQSKSDPLAEKLAVIRQKEAELLQKVYTKYKLKGLKAAKIAQREFTKVPKLNNPTATNKTVVAGQHSANAIKNDDTIGYAYGKMK